MDPETQKQFGTVGAAQKPPRAFAEAGGREAKPVIDERSALVTEVMG